MDVGPNSRLARALCAFAVVSAVPLLFCGVLPIPLHAYAFRHSFAWPRFGKMLVASITVPFIEEAFFRRIVLDLLLRIGRKYIAIIEVSMNFAAVHFLKAPKRTSEIVT